MTSKNLFYKLMKEDAKRRLWVIALTLLAFFFLYPVGTALLTNYASQIYSIPAQRLDFLTAELTKRLSVVNGTAVTLVIFGAVLWGITGFIYLHSKKKVDTYHSIPVRRELLFCTVYFNGILFMGVCLLLNMLLAVIMGGMNGVDTGVLLRTVSVSFPIHMIYFLLLYSVVTAAMMMTGQIIVSCLGIIVFFFYGTCISMLGQGYYSVWFRTYVASESSLLVRLMFKSSPVTAYVWLLEEMETTGKLPDSWMGALAAAIIISAFSLLLYKKRPSEAAGKAMAFPRSKVIIKTLLVIPAALGGALFFWGMQSTFGWAVFGLVSGLLFSHCIIEIIYHFDFRKLFSNKIQLLACGVVSMLILCGFRYDWTGYDSYLPKQEAVKYASVSISSMDDWVSYGRVREDNLLEWSGWEYMDASLYAEEHMKLIQSEEVYRIAEAGIKRYESLDWDRYTTDEEAQKYRYYTNVYVNWNLNNGRTVKRCYYFPLELVLDDISLLYQNQTYKEGVFPILTQSAEDTYDVNYQEMDQITELKLSSKADAADRKAKLLNAYQEDLKGLSIDTLKQEYPIGTIQFETKKMAEAKARYPKNDSRYYDVSGRCYYPVYPSFTNTIALLKEEGIEPGAGISPEQVERIIIRKQILPDDESNTSMDTGMVYKQEVYIDKTDKREVVFEVTDKNQIQELLGAMVPSDYIGMNWWGDCDPSCDLTVVSGTGVNWNEKQFGIRAGMVPPFLEELMKESK